MKKLHQHNEQLIFWAMISLSLLFVFSGFLWAKWIWLLACFVIALYVCWWFVRLMHVYRWFMQDQMRLTPPGTFGVLRAPVKRLILERQQTDKVQNNNKELIQQFRTMVEALPYATILLNKSLTIKYINDRAEQMFGLSQSDVGQPLQKVFGDSPVMDLFDQDKFTLKKASKEGLKMAQPTAPERLIKTRLIDANRYRFLLLGHDVSAMEALQKSRKNFMANASHELRTPLTVITGYLEYLQGHSNDLPQLSQAISQAYEQSQRMAHIISDMLALSRIEHDSVMPDKEEIIEMPQLLNSLFKDVRLSPNAQQHTLTAQIDSSLNLKGNRSEITSVCLNLLHNAVLHTPAGTHIELNWSQKSGQACLRVKDNGPGIDAKHVPHLTERFYRVAHSVKQKQDSTGLGLAIVKHIGLKHGAEFNIISQLGRGSCFSMLFPVSRTKVN